MMGTHIENGTNGEYVHADTIQYEVEPNVVYRNIPSPGDPEFRTSGGQNIYPSVERPRTTDESFTYYDRNGNPILFSQPPTNIAATPTTGSPVKPESDASVTPKKFERKGSFKKMKKQLTKIGNEIKNVPNKIKNHFDSNSRSRAISMEHISNLDESKSDKPASIKGRLSRSNSLRRLENFADRASKQILAVPHEVNRMRQKQIAKKADPFMVTQEEIITSLTVKTVTETEILSKHALSDSQIDRLTKLFYFFDRNGDDLISKDDIDTLTLKIVQYTGWEMDTLPTQLISQLLNHFWMSLVDDIYNENAGDYRKESITQEDWLNLFERFSGRAKAPTTLPSWIFIIPQVLFMFIDTNGDGTISKDELRRFYNVFMEMDFVGLVSRLTDVAYTKMTGGLMPLNLPLYQIIFADYLMGKSSSSFGQYIFGIFKTSTESQIKQALDDN